MFTIKVKSIDNDGRIYYTDALTVIDEPYETAEEAREVIAEWEELDRRAGEYMPDRYQVEEIPEPAAYVTKDKEGDNMLDMMNWEDRIIARWEAQQERWDHGGDCFYNCVPWDCPFYNFCPFS